MATSEQGMRTRADQGAGEPSPVGGESAGPQAMMREGWRLFEEGLRGCADTQRQLSGLWATAVKQKAEIDNLDIDMRSTKAHMVRNTEIEGRTNEVQREAIYRGLLESDDRFAANEQRFLEVNEEYAQTRSDIQLAENWLSINKRKMEFANCLLSCAAGFVPVTGQAASASPTR